VLGLMDAVFRLRAVVEVPGYHNLQEFTGDWQTLITNYLSWVQVEDSYEFSWLRGARAPYASASALRSRMEQLYQAVVEQDKIQYLAVKTQGDWLDTHALLVIDAYPIENGYGFDVVDSASSQLEHLRYKDGDENLEYLIPFLQRDDDYRLIEAALKNYCR
jgi:hypothetical protein